MLGFSVIFYFFFLLKLPLPFFGLITLGLYLGVIKSLAIEFFFSSNKVTFLIALYKVLIIKAFFYFFSKPIHMGFNRMRL